MKDKTKSNTYEENYHSLFHKKLLTNTEYYLFRAKYADKIYWKYFSNTKNGKFLEFGCGIGQNIFLHRNNSTGIDISDFAIKQCKTKGINAIKDIRKVDSGSIEGVLCCHVLEHLEEPAYYLKHFLRVLKKGGRLVLVLPVSKGEDKRPPDFKAWHLYSWTVSAIWALLHTIGFEIKIARFNYASGFSLFHKLPLPLAMAVVKFVGYLRNQKEMIVVAEKR